MIASRTAQDTLRENDLIVISGAEGFIGGSLAGYFCDLGFNRIRAVDKNPLPNWYQRISGIECLCLANRFVGLLETWDR